MADELRSSRALPSLAEQVEWVRKMRDDHVAARIAKGDEEGPGTWMIEALLATLEAAGSETAPASGRSLSEDRVKEIAGEACVLDGIGAAPYKDVIAAIQKALAEQRVAAAPIPKNSEGLDSIYTDAFNACGGSPEQAHFAGLLAVRNASRSMGAPASEDAARIDFLAEVTDINVRRDLFDQELKPEETERLERAGNALSIGYERHRRTKDTPTAFRAAVDNARSGER